jgi:uncharacterized protein (TIGR02145 family)
VSIILILVTTGCKGNKDSITITDIDGNIYNTVTIGSQIWHRENLKTTRYSNRDPIPEITDGTQWINRTYGAYCNYNNDPG